MAEVKKASSHLPLGHFNTITISGFSAWKWQCLYSKTAVTQPVFFFFVSNSSLSFVSVSPLASSPLRSLFTAWQFGRSEHSYLSSIFVGKIWYSNSITTVISLSLTVSSPFCGKTFQGNSIRFCNNIFSSSLQKALGILVNSHWMWTHDGTQLKKSFCIWLFIFTFSEFTSWLRGS